MKKAGGCRCSSRLGGNSGRRALLPWDKSTSLDDLARIGAPGSRERLQRQRSLRVVRPGSRQAKVPTFAECTRQARVRDHFRSASEPAQRGDS